MKRCSIAAVALCLAALLPATAGAATSFFASASPSRAGYVDVTLTTEIKGESGGPPLGAAATVTQLLPGEFAHDFDRFGTCGVSAFSNAQGPTDANCRDDTAVIGNGVLSAVADYGQGPVTLTSDRASVVKTGRRAVALWWHVDASQFNPEMHGIFPGRLTAAGGRVGVVWNTTSLPAPARLSIFETTYAHTTALDAAPFAARSCRSGSWVFDSGVAYGGEGAPAPEAGTWSQSCRRGTTFTIPPSRCKVPRLRAGSTLSAARARLRRVGCTPGRVRRAGSATVPEGRVIRYSPASGRRVARGRRVSIVVSSGP